MALNLSDFDYVTIYRINPILHISFFVVLCIPALFLNALCILALLLSRSAHINIQIILLNIFAAELAQILGMTVLFLGHPARIHDEDIIDYSCNFAFSALFCGGLVKLPATSLYAIAVYIHIQYGRKKIKSRVIVACCVLMWLVSISICVLPYTNLVTITSSHGFCYTTESSTAYKIIVNVSFGITATLSTILTVGFAVRSFFYVKHNTMQGHNRSTHKAVKNMLLYLIIGIFISLFNYMLEPAVFEIVKEVKKSTNAASLDLALYYIFNGLFVFPVVLTPIFTIALLKPVRETLKRIFAIRSSNTPNPLSPTYLENMMDTELGSRAPHLAKTITLDPDVGRELAVRPRPVIRFNLPDLEPPSSPKVPESASSPKQDMEPEPASTSKPSENPERLISPNPAVDPEPTISLSAAATPKPSNTRSVINAKPALEYESVFGADSGIDAELDIVAVKQEAVPDDRKVCDSSSSSEFTIIYRSCPELVKEPTLKPKDHPAPAKHQKSAVNLLRLDAIELEVVKTNPIVSSDPPSSEFVVIYKPAL